MGGRRGGSLAVRLVFLYRERERKGVSERKRRERGLGALEIGSFEIWKLRAWLKS